MAMPPRNAKGQFQSAGGGGSSVGGIDASISLDTTPLEAGVAHAQNTLSSLTASVNSASGGVGKLDAAAGAGGRGMASFGSRMMVAASFADDMQYGLRAVVNQIPMVTAAFGMGAGLGGALSIVAVLVNQVNTHWDDLTRSFKSDAVMSAAKEMEELGKKTKLTAAEQERLNKLKKEASQDEQQKSARPDAEKKMAEAFGKAIREGPRETIEERLAAGLRVAPGKVTDAELEAALAPERAEAMQGRAPRGISEQRKTELRRQLQMQAEDAATEASKAEARRLLRESELGVGQEGEAARKRLRGLVGADAGMPGSFRRNIDAAATGQPVLNAEERRKALEDRLKADLEERDREKVADKAAEQAKKDRPLEEAYKEGLAQKAAEEAGVKHGEGLTATAQEEVKAEKERLAEQMKIREELNKNTLTRSAGLERLDEKESDLTYRLYQEMNPTREGQSLGLDAYEASIKGMTGETLEAKRLHRIIELNEELVRVAHEKKTVGTVRRRS